MMLLANPNARIQTDSAQPARGADLIALPEIVSLARRYRFTIIGAIAAALVAASIYVAISTPMFLASARLMIEPQRPQLFWQEPGMLDLTIDNAQVESQVEVLRSERIATSVLAELELAGDGEFQGEVGGLSRLAAFIASLPIPGFAPSPRDAPRTLSDFEQTRRAIAAFNNRLSVRRIGQSYVIEISFQSSDPEKAARVANATANAYIRDQLEGKVQVSRRGSEWLQGRITELRSELNAAARAVQQFKAENNIVSAGGRGLLDDQQLAEINTQLVNSRAQTADARAKLARVDEVIASGVPGGAVSEALNSATINNLRQRYLDASGRELEFTDRYGRDHPSTVNARHEKSEHERAILDELRRIGESYRSDYEIAKSREEGLAAQLQRQVRTATTTRQAQVTLQELESLETSYRRMYESFLQKLTETIQKETFPVSDARVITAATKPLGKSYPHTKLILAMATLVGSVIGLGAATLQNSLDRSIRSPNSIRRELGLDCLSVLPLVAGEARRSPSDRVRGFTLPQWSAPRGTLAYDEVVENGSSAFSNALRGAKVSIDLACSAVGVRSIGIVSALRGEGKSTIASNLSELFAISGRRTILLDCDLRDADLTRTIANDASTGLVDILYNTHTLGDVVLSNEMTKLDILPAGTRAFLPSAENLLGSDRMRKLLDELRSSYEIILLDLPGLSTAVDARVVAPFLDAVIFIAEWGRTPLDMLREAVDSLEPTQTRLVGAILNKAEESGHTK